MSRQLPSVTVVICARNAAAHLGGSISSALAQDYPRDRYRVLVVDNGSTDETRYVARAMGAAVRGHRRPGIAGARRFAVETIRSGLIAFLDADCEAPTNWLSSLVPEFLDERGTLSTQVGAVGIRLVSDEPRTLAERHIDAGGMMDTDRMFTRNALQFPFVVCAGMVARRDALREVGAFDPGFGRAAGEDADACWRLRRNGWEVRYRRDVTVLHHHRASVGAMLRQVRWYGAGSAELFARWRKELGWRRYTDWRVYQRLVGGLATAPFALLLRSGYERHAPTLRALDAAAFLCGKLRRSIEKRILFL